jgi:glycosyltransferase involved in cell wall biosynthesis
MHILLLSQWYPPEPALLQPQLVESLQALGHRVTVLTGFPNYPSGDLYPGYQIRLYQKEELAGASVVRVPLYPDHSKSAKKRVANYLSFAVSVALLAGFLIEKPDVLFVYHPPLSVGAPAWLLSRLLAATGMLNNHALLEYIGSFAQWVYRKSAAICVISPGFRSNLIEKGVSPDKVHVISNWVDSVQLYPVAPDASLATSLGLAGKFNVMFAGNLGEAQGLERVIEAASLLQHEKSIQFVFVGDGTARPMLEARIKQLGLDNVRFLGRYPSSQMAALYALADVLLVHLKRDPLFAITIPHKIFSYMACAKPILGAVEGDSANLIRSAQAGLICPPEDAAALAETVLEFCSMSEEQRRLMGARGRETVVASYDRTILVNQIEQILCEVVATS